MTKEIKDALSQEIKDQIAAEKTAAANKDKAGNDSGPPAALDPNIRYFLVANQEDLTTSDGNECILTGGDVIFRTGDKPDDDHMVDATVKSSRKDKDECPVDATVSVSTDDIMDMYNNMRQNMADGMKEMAAKNGKNGLPKAPDTSTTAGEIPDTNARFERGKRSESGPKRRRRGRGRRQATKLTPSAPRSTQLRGAPFICVAKNQARLQSCHSQAREIPGL